MVFTPLARPLSSAGRPRRAGFELEFAGLSPQDAANVVAQVYGGVVEKQSRFSFTCKAKVGVFDIVLDAQMLTTLKHRKLFKEFGIDLEKIDQEEWVERAIEKGASVFVPCEVTTPPLEEKEFDTLEKLARALVAQGAKGTTHTVYYAFGLHINLEIPDLSVATLLTYLRAYFLLEPYLQEISHIDLARRLSNFIDPFPEAYVQKVLHPSYAPASSEALMRDYFEHNPTRNRSLDMSPIFGMIDKPLTQQSLQEPQLLKPRPALHYRLPNCSLGEEGWSVATEWNRFMLVEMLAQDEASMKTLLAQMQEIAAVSVFGKKNKQKELVEQWAISLASA